MERDIGKAVVGIERARVDCQRPLIALPRRVKQSLRHAHLGEAKMGGALVAPDGNRFAEMERRLIEAAERLQRFRKVEMAVGIARIDSKRTTHKIDPRLALSGQVHEEAEQMQAVGVPGIEAQEFAAMPLCFRMPPRVERARGRGE